MRRLTRVTAIGIMSLSLFGGPVAQAQSPGASGSARHSPPATDPEAFPVPFGPGEEAVYQLKLGIVSVGEGRLSVPAIDTVRGHPTYRLELDIEGGVAFAKVDDLFQSWLDTRTLASRRFVRDLKELGRKDRREWSIFPEEKRWKREDADKEGETLSTLPLDELAFVYYIRTLPLKVGETYNLTRYFKEDGNPVVVKVLRKERKEVPGGTYNTIVVQPVIKTSGLFGEGGNAEVYFTDDDKRHVVYLRSEVPLVGSLTLHLKSVREGTPLNPASRGRPGGRTDGDSRR